MGEGASLEGSFGRTGDGLQGLVQSLHLADLFVFPAVELHILVVVDCEFSDDGIFLTRLRLDCSDLLQPLCLLLVEVGPLTIELPIQCSLLHLQFLYLVT